MARKSYFHDILSVFGSSLSVTISNLLVGVMLSRLLGAGGFGLYSYIIVVPVIVIGFTQLGIRRSTIYHIGQRTVPEEELFSALFLLWIYSSILSIIICGVTYFFSATQPFDPLIIVLVLMTIPLLLLNLFAGGVFLGKEEIFRANIINAGPTLMTLVLTVFFVWILRMGILGAFLAIALANFSMFFYVYYVMVNKYRYHVTWKYHERLMKSMVKLGLINALAIFVMQLNYRLDILMLKKLSTLEQVGYYSLAMQIAEQLWHIPYAIELIILSRSANTNDNEFVHKTVASIFRVSLVLALAGGLIIFFVTPLIVPLLFGKDFIHSVPMIQVVLPGILILVGFRILNSRIVGMGKPQIAIYTFVPALLINFLVNLFMIPRYGGIGAAWSTNISYALGSIAFFIVYSRMTGMSAAQILLFRRSDFYFLRDLKALRPRKKNHKV